MIRALSLAALTVIIVPTMVHAQAPTGRAPVDDTLFANAAALGGLAEVSLSELGVQKATDPELKRFSQQMVTEHTQLNADLNDLASQKSYTLPRAVDARAQFCAQNLGGMSGEDFDRHYAKAQLVAHMDAAAAFEAEAERGQDADVKSFAARALPRIREHLRMIRPIAMRYEMESPSKSLPPASR